MVYYTKFSNIHFIEKQDGQKIALDDFDIKNEKDQIVKKYSIDDSIGIRSSFFYLKEDFNEDVLWSKFNLKKDNLEKIRKIQDNIKISHDNYDLIPRDILYDFGIEYLDFIKNCYGEIKDDLNLLNKKALINFDRAKIVLEKMFFSHPFLSINKKFPINKNYENFIYKINKFSFLRVVHSQSSNNGMIYSHDRSIANISSDDNIKKCVKSRFGRDGKILTIDYNAFHPRIIFALAGYDNLHEEKDFYELLKEKLLLHDIDRNDLKLLLFQIFYGNLINDNIKNKFEKIFNLKNKLEIEYNKSGYITSITGKRKFLQKDEIRTKLLNSYIQMTHSDIINEMLCKIDNFLKDKKTKLIGIISDSFIFDVHICEKDLLRDFLISNLQVTDFLNNCFLKININEGDSWASCS